MYKILVVDDDPICLTVVKTMLQESYEVATAKSGVQALGSMKLGTLPDMVLLDMLMPGMSGLDVLRNMRASEKLRDIPVLLVSGMEDLDAQVDGYAQGAKDFIPKPVIAPILKRKLEMHLHILELERAQRESGARRDRLCALLQEALGLAAGPA